MLESTLVLRTAPHSSSVFICLFICLFLTQRAGLRNTLDVQVNKPLLMFWPTDDAIRALPNNISAKLHADSHLSELIQFVQYHVVVNIQVSCQVANLHRRRALISFEWLLVKNSPKA